MIILPLSDETCRHRNLWHWGLFVDSFPTVYGTLNSEVCSPEYEQYESHCSSNRCLDSAINPSLSHTKACHATPYTSHVASNHHHHATPWHAPKQGKLLEASAKDGVSVPKSRHTMAVRPYPPPQLAVRPNHAAQEGRLPSLVPPS